MNRVAVLALLAAATTSRAQVPDVRVKFDVTLALRIDSNNKTTFKPFNLLGRHSTVSLTFFLEPGFRGFISEKIQPFPNEVDRQPFDEYYVEDEGIWRVGKQYLPFGNGSLLAESVLAARGDTNLILERFPVSVALCDGGSGYQRGVVARLGSRTGVSVAYGDHFGIASSALTLIRRPEDSPGRGRGWKLAVGADYLRKVGNVTFRAEGVTLRNGETPADKDLTVGDINVMFQPNAKVSYQLGWTHVFPMSADIIRAGASFKITNIIAFEPLIRYRDSKLFDASLELRLRF